MGISGAYRDCAVCDIVRIRTTDTLSTAAGATYLTEQADNLAAANNGTWSWENDDLVLVAASDGPALFTVSSDETHFIAYNATGNGAVTLPVTSGHFTVFDGTLGALKDAAYAPSDAVGPFVVMSPGSVTSGRVVKFNGVNGTVADAGFAATAVAISTITSPDPQSDILQQDFTLGFAALASAGKVNIQVSSGSKQYCIRDVRINKSTGLSGGGGDRLLAISDSTNVWTGTGITAALLGTPINTLWGGSGLPLPSGANAFSTFSTAGANLFFQYTGGTTDFTAGSVIITVKWQRVA